MKTNCRTLVVAQPCSAADTIDVSKLALVGLQTELCHILRDDDLGPHLPHHCCPDVEDLRVWPSQHTALAGSVQVLPAVCVSEWTVRHSLPCVTHQAATGMSSLCRSKERTLSGSACCLHALMSEMYCRTLFGAILTRLSKEHPGVAEWARITSCAIMPHSHAHKLRIRIGQSPSLSWSKPENCWLVADMIWSAVSGEKVLEYVELWLILRLLKQNSRSLRDMMRPSRRRSSASLHQPAATSCPVTVREIDMRRLSKLPNIRIELTCLVMACLWAVGDGDFSLMNQSCRHQNVHGNGGLACVWAVGDGGFLY